MRFTLHACQSVVHATRGKRKAHHFAMAVEYGSQHLGHEIGSLLLGIALPGLMGERGTEAALISMCTSALTGAQIEMYL